MTAPSQWSAPPVAAGTLVVAGIVAVAVPQHALSVARVLLVGLAVVALGAAAARALGGIDLAQHLPGLDRSPFAATRPRQRFHRDRPTSLDRVRSEVGSGYVRADLAPLTPATARRLVTIMTAVLEREGLDPGDQDQADEVRARLSPQAWTAVTANRSVRARGKTTYPRRPAAAEEVAATVHAVLDELERPPTPRGAP